MTSSGSAAPSRRGASTCSMIDHPKSPIPLSTAIDEGPRRGNPAGDDQGLLNAPDLEIVLLIVVAWNERVLVTALGVDVFLGHEERRLYEAARRFVVESAVQLVDRL